MEVDSVLLTFERLVCLFFRHLFVMFLNHLCQQNVPIAQAPIEDEWD